MIAETALNGQFPEVLPFSKDAWPINDSSQKEGVSMGTGLGMHLFGELSEGTPQGKKSLTVDCTLASTRAHTQSTLSYDMLNAVAL